MEKKIKVLIVDDHSLFRTGLEALLNKLDIVDSIFQASNGDEAFELVKLYPIDIIFMDVRMKGSDGILTTQRIIKFNGHARIIALTMLDDKASVTRMFNAGAVGFLTKSTSSEEIFRAIAEVLLGNRFICSDFPSELLKEFMNSRKSEVASLNCDFTKRELEVMKLICQGYSNKEASQALNISVKSIEAIKSKLFDKTGATNAIGLVTFAYENQIIYRL